MKPLLFAAALAACLATGCGLSKMRESTPVIDAARAGNVQQLERLLSAGADPDQRAGVNDWTPLMHAIHKGQRESVGVLLKHGADANAATDNGGTPLIEAAGYGYSDIVGLLLDAGAKPDVRDHDGYTALNAAIGGVPDHDRFTVGHCQTDTVRALLERAPQLRLRDTFADNTAVRVAKFAGCADVIKLVRYQQ